MQSPPAPSSHAGGTALLSSPGTGDAAGPGGGDRHLSSGDRRNGAWGRGNPRYTRPRPSPHTTPGSAAAAQGPQPQRARPAVRGARGRPEGTGRRGSAPPPRKGGIPRRGRGRPHLLNLSWSRRMGPGRPPRPGDGRVVGTGGCGRLLRRRGPESGPSLACEPPRRAATAGAVRR